MVSKHRKLTIIYFIFLGVTFLTILPVILYFFGVIYIWTWYAYFYAFTIFLYLWYRFINLAYSDFKIEEYDVNLYTPFTVVIPCYNESAELLTRCVESVVNAQGEKQIIIIDDGSKNNIYETIKLLEAKYDNISSHRFKKNMGKRHALHYAFKKIKTEFVITIDSDTLIEKYAFAYLLAPFCDKKVGATTGNIYLLNEKRNLLTRVIAAMYLSGLNNYKKSQSVLGNVICCSGCLAAYRMNVIEKIADDFLYQKFLGYEATHSEDRHLTNLTLEMRYKVKYVDRAICYTESPHTLKSFLKQQQRWKRGFVRESIYLLSHSYRTSKTLFFESIIGNALPYFMSFGIQIFIISTIFIMPHSLLYLIPSWVIFMTIRELPMFLEDPKRSVWFYLYIPLYEVLLFWQNMWAIVTVNNKGWLTRNG